MYQQQQPAWVAQQAAAYNQQQAQQQANRASQLAAVYDRQREQPIPGFGMGLPIWDHPAGAGGAAAIQ